MPVIRSPQKARSAMPPPPPLDDDANDAAEQQENVVSNKINHFTTTIAQQKRAQTTKRGPAVTVVADSTTRIWELEGEIARLERDKRFFEEERRKLIEERETELAEMNKQFAQQLDAEKKRAQKELEACNAQWRNEVEEADARQERREKEFERKLAQTKESLKADLDADFSVALEASERQCARLKAQVEALELEMKEKSRVHQEQIQALEMQLEQARTSHEQALVLLRTSAESSKAKMLADHAAELSAAVEAAKAEMRLVQLRETNEALESCRAAHMREIETLKSDLTRANAEQMAELIRKHEREMEELRNKIGKAGSAVEDELRALKDKYKLALAQNESLRASLWREQEERAQEERRRMVEMEVAQQRTDEAVARALSIVKRTEDKIAMAVTRGWVQGTPPPPPPPSKYVLANVPAQPQPVSRGTPRPVVSNIPNRESPRLVRRARASSVGSSPSYALQTQSSLAKSEYDFRRRF